MATASKLYMSHKWDLQEIKDLIENYTKYSVEIKTKPKIHPNCSVFTLSDGTNINVHTDGETPIGDAVLLTTFSQATGLPVLEVIQRIFGGLLQPDDCEEIFKMEEGFFSKEKGIMYHFRQAVINRKVTGTSDIDGLSKAIDDWCKEVSSKITE